MSALLSRNAGSRPGVTGTARVDRDIDRLLRRINPGDIVVMDALDLDRITADALVEVGVAAVVNASTSISGRYPNLGPEVLVNNNITLIDEAGPEIFKKIKDGARVRLHNGGVYAGDRRIALGTERTERRDPRPDARGQERARRAPRSLRRQHHRVHPQREPAAHRRHGHPRHRRRREPQARRGGRRGTRARPRTYGPSSRSSRSTTPSWSASEPARTFCARRATDRHSSLVIPTR